jgi:hypothetical protein
MIGFRKKQPSSRRRQAASYEKNRAYTYRSARSPATDSNPDRSRTPGKNDEQGGKFAKRLSSAGFIMGLLIAIASVVFMTALGSEASIAIKDNQPAYRPSERYQEKADEILGQTLNNRWKISIQKADIARQMQESFPEIANINISTPPWSYKPILKIAMNEPALIFVSTGEEFLVDKSGIALVEAGSAPSSLKTDNLAKVTDETSHIAKTGKNVLSAEQVSFIREIIFQAKSKRFDTSDILLKPGGEEVHFKFKQAPYTVKFSFDNDARRSAGAFLALEKHLSKNGQLPDQYIDARVPERAFVR